MDSTKVHHSIGGVYRWGGSSSHTAFCLLAIPYNNVPYRRDEKRDIEVDAILQSADCAVSELESRRWSLFAVLA